MTKITKQLIFEGFPEPKHKEAYTGPKIRSERPYGSNPKYKNFEPLIPYISISPDYFATYAKRASSVIDRAGKTKSDQQEDISEHKRKLIEDLQAARKKHRDNNAGTLSRSGRARMKQRCGYLFYHSSDKIIHNVAKGYTYKMKLNVITLTITEEQMHDDKFLKRKLYKNFIDALRKRYPGISYVWKAETQENGNLHFHILTDHYVPVWYSNGLWLGILKRNGYKYGTQKEVFDETLDKKTRVFVKLNPVDTEKVRNEKDLGRYMRKYMMKGLDDAKLPELKKQLQKLYTDIHFCDTPSKKHDLQVEMLKLKKRISSMERRKVLGKLWGCSDNLVLKPYSVPIEYLGKLFPGVIRHANEVTPKGLEYTKIYDIPDLKTFMNVFRNVVTEGRHKELDDHLAKVFPKNPCPYTEFWSNKNYAYDRIAC